VWFLAYWNTNATSWRCSIMFFPFQIQCMNLHDAQCIRTLITSLWERHYFEPLYCMYISNIMFIPTPYHTGRPQTPGYKNVINVMTSSDGHHWIRSDTSARMSNETCVVEVERPMKTWVLLINI
jgi:hypothetical protein